MALPIDERALLVLKDMTENTSWYTHPLDQSGPENNYLSQYRDHPAARSVAEAFAWLRGHAYVARSGKDNDQAVFVTDRGHEALRQDIGTIRAAHRIEYGVHHLINQRVRRQFLLGEYEQAVFVAMKAVEVRVRKLGQFPDDLVGVSLMTQAFRPAVEDKGRISQVAGPLSDPTRDRGEQTGMMNLFQGCYAVLRNPPGHREVNYDDVAEAAEALATASLLMRILDVVEDRLKTHSRRRRRPDLKT